MKFDKYYYTQSDTANISFITVDTAGTPKGNQKMKYRVIYKEPNVSGEEYTEENIPEEKILAEKELISGVSGTVQEKFTFEQVGLYTVEVSIGNYTTSHNIYVSGRSNILPIQNENQIHITTDKPDYQA